MPRMATHPHVLRDLRGTIGQTQARFAQMVGVKPITINRIENGSLLLSPDLAIRIQLATGVSIDELTKGTTGKLLDHFGRRYSSDSFRWWKKKFNLATEHDAVRRARNLHWWMEILLRAAARSRGGTEYNGAIARLIQSMNEIRRNFGLDKATDAILREYEPHVEWRPGGHRPEDLRKIQQEEKMESSDWEPQPRVHWSGPKPQSKQPSKKKKRRR